MAASARSALVHLVLALLLLAAANPNLAERFGDRAKTLHIDEELSLRPKRSFVFERPVEQNPVHKDEYFGSRVRREIDAPVPGLHNNPNITAKVSKLFIYCIFKSFYLVILINNNDTQK